MVGNDIVDLRDPDADSTRYRTRFDERVFSEAERRVIACSGSSERERWRMWAAKEASYKLARRRDPETIFSPRLFAVGPDPAGRVERARVTHGENAYCVEFDETPERIHAVAVSNPDDFASLLVGVEDRAEVCGSDFARAELDESEAVRQFACDVISQRFELPRDELAIHKREDRVPELRLGNRLALSKERARENESLGLSLSLSHHGRWLAFACYQGEDRGA